LRDWSLIELGNYYKRLVSWYTNGGFTDEYGIFHNSGYFYKIPYWEVLNEVEYEHSMTVEYYTLIYDAIVDAILEVQPNMQFVGMALAGHDEWNWYEYFLNQSNHRANIPLDFISFHFYASCQNRTEVSQYNSFFGQADVFIAEVEHILTLKGQLSPDTRIDIDEIGVILPNDNNLPAPVPDPYWNAAGAMYAYLFGNLALQGVDVLGESQLVGYPTQFPSVSEVDWNTGDPNARLWVLTVLIDNIRLGDQFVVSNSTDSNIFALGYLSNQFGKQILLINKLNEVTDVQIDGLSSGTITYVDTTTAFAPPITSKFTGDTVTLGEWSVAIISDIQF